jgi:hypothetical protein
LLLSAIETACMRVNWSGAYSPHDPSSGITNSDEPISKEYQRDHFGRGARDRSASTYWAETVQRGALPWDQSLDTIAALLSGPIAHALLAFAAIMAFVIYGIVGDGEAGRRLFKAGFGMAVAIEAVKFLNYLLPY